MILMKPLTVTEEKLTSTIPEPDSSVGEVEWSAGTYDLGDRAIKSSTHSVYEVVADPSTTDDPEVGVNATPATWVYVSPTNKYKMFDQANNTASEGDNIVVDFTPVQLVNSVAAFNVDCNDITVKIYDVTDAVIYEKSIAMTERPLVNGWYNYFYSGFSITTKFVLLDLPPTTQNRIEVTFTGTDASVGTLIFGKQVKIGEAQWGTGAELLDFSNPEEDDFGNITFSDGFTAKLINYDVMIDTPSLDPVFTEVASLGKKPAVFVGNPTSIGDSTLVYGFVRDFQSVYTWPSKSKISLTVRGLV